MNALDLMKALRDVPDDLIDECFTAPRPHVTEPEEQTDIFEECLRKSFPAPVQTHTEQPKPMRLLPYLTVAACLLFAVGFGAVMLHGSRSDLSAQTSSEQIITETMPNDSKPLSETDPAGFAELELHEPPRSIALEEVNRIRDEAVERYLANGSKPALIDTEKYIAKYFTEDSAADYNDPEAKSYLYHMMLNSIDYFRTAEGTMEIERSDGDFQTDFQCDIGQKRSYELQSKSGNVVKEEYRDGKYLYEPVINTKYYMETLMFTESYPDMIYSDNDRVFKYQEGDYLSYLNCERPPLSYTQMNTCLFPQNVAMKLLWDFDTWQVKGTETMLGRTCAVIEGTNPVDGYSFKICADVSTGIMLYYENVVYTNGEARTIQMTSLTLDADIDVKRFDPTGYRCMNPSDGDFSVQETPHVKEDYQVNESGQTYGKTPDSLDPEDYPDLIAVIGDNGKEGYIYKMDYISDIADSPEEASKIADAQHNGTYVPKSYNVYASDGKTVIDTFTEQ